MKNIISLACLGLVIAVSSPAFAGSQQDKMRGCNIEAKGMKGDERKAFMKKCLKKDYVLKSAATTTAPSTAANADAKSTASAVAPSSAKISQKDKMKSCNADAKAKGLKGAERKKFMSSCLKG
jgi:hypothetical protein